MECRDRYFMIAVNLSFTGEDPHFEATGKIIWWPHWWVKMLGV